VVDLHVLCESWLKFNEKIHRYISCVLFVFPSFTLLLQDLNHSSRLCFSFGSGSVSFFSCRVYPVSVFSTCRALWPIFCSISAR
jgi:hypothetical protein